MAPRGERRGTSFAASRSLWLVFPSLPAMWAHGNVLEMPAMRGHREGRENFASEGPHSAHRHGQSVLALGQPRWCHDQQLTEHYGINRAVNKAHHRMKPDVHRLSAQTDRRAGRDESPSISSASDICLRKSYFAVFYTREWPPKAGTIAGPEPEVERLILSACLSLVEAETEAAETSIRDGGLLGWLIAYCSAVDPRYHHSKGWRRLGR
ncbi:hypothetical protein F5X68DRAFT_72360 [Plectosphaerella plurivora]|uniref:Uncharacterized protein n=1 Tax=Plectosphaerella plurivora TaxID=936078 RepID=A0A9P8VEZ4_9PEZI|nr:hypothetical protein F5X68DRAFT_72360 [Plectosphaerella plurivora]